MFAVIVLGIGFIMIAAVFPVAIQQGKTNSEEASAANTAREALAYLGYAGANGDSDYYYPDSKGGPLFPATGGANAPYYGQVYSISDSRLDAIPNRLPKEIWNLVKGHIVVPSDQRIAFTALYRRDGNPADRKTWSPFAQVWFIPVAARQRSIYDAKVDVTSSNLQAQISQVSIAQPNGVTSATKARPGYVLWDWSAKGQASLSRITEGCYIIIADDKIVTPAVNTGRMNGRIYHVALRRPDLDTVNTTPTPNLQGTAYDLNPDGDFTPDAGFNGAFDTTGAPIAPSVGSDDIFCMGLSNPAATYDPSTPGASVLTAASALGNASGPASVFVLGADNAAGGAPAGKSQDISAYTTFIKVN